MPAYFQHLTPLLSWPFNASDCGSRFMFCDPSGTMLGPYEGFSELSLGQLPSLHDILSVN